MKQKTTGYALLACSALFGLTMAAGAQADVGKLAETCASCHGKGGASTEADVPSIGGYSEEYFVTALKAYKSKDRPCVETKIRSGDKKGTKTDMCQIVKDLSDADIKALAQNFAEKKFVRTPQKFDPALAKKGKDVHDKNCEKCHSEGGSVASDDAGILAGQKMAYLKEQTEFFLGGKRAMVKKMKPKLEGLDKAEVEAVIHFYGSFK